MLKKYRTLLMASFIVFSILTTICIYTFISLTKDSKQDQISTEYISDQRKVTVTNLKTNKEYNFTENGLGKIKFNTTSVPSPKLSVKSIKTQVLGIEFPAYEFSTNQENGTFSYDLELPNEYGLKGVAMYSEDGGKSFVPVKSTNLGKSIEIKNQNHFTIWVVVGDETAERYGFSTYSLYINEISLNTTPEWVEIYNNSIYEADLTDIHILFDKNNTTNQKITFPAGEKIAPKEYKIVELNNPPYWLNNSVDTIKIMGINTYSGLYYDFPFDTVGYNSTPTYEMSVYGQKLGTVPSGGVLARKFDGLGSFEIRSQNNATKGMSNDLIPTPKPIVSIGAGNNGNQGSTQNSSNLPSPTANFPTNQMPAHRSVIDVLQTPVFVTAYSNIGISEISLRVIKDGETELNKDITAPNGINSGGYTLLLNKSLENEPSATEKGILNGILNLDPTMNNYLLPSQQFPDGDYWIILGATDKNGQRNESDPNLDPRIKITVNNTNLGILKVKKLFCHSISIGSNSVQIGNNTYSEGDLRNVYTNFNDPNCSPAPDSYIKLYHEPEDISSSDPRVGPSFSLYRGRTDFQGIFNSIRLPNNGRFVVKDDTVLNNQIMICSNGQSNWNDNWDYLIFGNTDPLSGECLILENSQLGTNSISGEIFNDQNMNSIKDPGETLVQNFEAYLMNSQSVISNIQYSNFGYLNSSQSPLQIPAVGNFRFENLNNANYSICFSFPFASEMTAPESGKKFTINGVPVEVSSIYFMSPCIKFNLTNGGDVTGLKIGVCEMTNQNNYCSPNVSSSSISSLSSGISSSFISSQTNSSYSSFSNGNSSSSSTSSYTFSSSSPSSVISSSNSNSSNFSSSSNFQSSSINSQFVASSQNSQTSGFSSSSSIVSSQKQNQSSSQSTITKSSQTNQQVSRSINPNNNSAPIILQNSSESSLDSSNSINSSDYSLYSSDSISDTLRSKESESQDSFLNESKQVLGVQEIRECETFYNPPLWVLGIVIVLIALSVAVFLLKPILAIKVAILILSLILNGLIIFDFVDKIGRCMNYFNWIIVLIPITICLIAQIFTIRKSKKKIE